YARRILASLSESLDPQRRVIALPDIVPLRAWLQQAGDTLSFVPEAGLASHVVDAFGARSVWERVITDMEAEHVLLDAGQAAALAVGADRMTSEWQLSVQPGEETLDHQRVLLWRDEYRRRLQSLDAEDGVLGCERVCAAVQAGLLEYRFSRLVL